MFAVIKTGGKQYRVGESDRIVVEKLEGDAGDEIRFDQILMLGGEKNVTLGEPFVEGAIVAGQIEEQRKGEKLLVFKKKRRKNYRRKKGHRQQETVVQITQISADGKLKSKKAATAKPKTKEAPAKATEKKTAPKKATAKPAKAEAQALFAVDPKVAKDDLKQISGVGPVLEKKLHDLGVTTFAQIAKFTKKDIDMVDERLNFKGRIDREDWIGQAKKLAKDTK